MARTNLAAKFPPSQKENIPELDVQPEIQEKVFEEVRIRVPGTIFEVDQDGYIRLPKELLQKMLDNLS